MIHIYCIYFPTSNKYYIGQTNDLQRRMKQHLCSNSAICNALYKYDDWQVSVLHTCKSRDEANRIEIEEIRNFNSIAPNGYNITRGGSDSNGFEGHSHTEEAKNKIRKANLGNKSRTGQTNSKESNEKNRLAQLGNQRAKGHTWKLIQETKDKMMGNQNAKGNKISKKSIVKRKLNYFITKVTKLEAELRDAGINTNNLNSTLDAP